MSVSAWAGGYKRKVKFENIWEMFGKMNEARTSVGGTEGLRATEVDRRREKMRCVSAVERLRLAAGG